MHTLRTFHTDEAGFIISSELILIATVAVLAMVVGLTEVRSAVVEELEDVGSAVGSMQQSYWVEGLVSHDKAGIAGSAFDDEADYCDGQDDIRRVKPIGEDKDFHDDRY